MKNDTLCLYKAQSCIYQRNKTQLNGSTRIKGTVYSVQSLVQLCIYYRDEYEIDVKRFETEVCFQIIYKKVKLCA